MKNLLRIVNALSLLGIFVMLLLIYRELPHIPTIKEYHETIRLDDKEKRKSKLDRLPYIRINDNVDANTIGSDGPIEVRGGC
jgi:hypothetical protein